MKQHTHYHENEKFIEKRLVKAFEKKYIIPLHKQKFFESKAAKKLGLSY